MRVSLSSSMQNLGPGRCCVCDADTDLTMLLAVPVSSGDIIYGQFFICESSCPDTLDMDAIADTVCEAVWGGAREHVDL